MYTRMPFLNLMTALMHEKENQKKVKKKKAPHRNRKTPLAKKNEKRSKPSNDDLCQGLFKWSP